MTGRGLSRNPFRIVQEPPPQEDGQNAGTQPSPQSQDAPQPPNVETIEQGTSSLNLNIQQVTGIGRGIGRGIRPPAPIQHGGVGDESSSSDVGQLLPPGHRVVLPPVGVHGPQMPSPHPSVSLGTLGSGGSGGMGRGKTVRVLTPDTGYSPTVTQSGGDGTRSTPPVTTASHSQSSHSMPIVSPARPLTVISTSAMPRPVEENPLRILNEEDEGEALHVSSLITTYAGSKGAPFPAKGNFLRIKIREDKEIHEYYATFEPNFDDTITRRKIITQLSAELENARTSDGTRLFLPKKLQGEVTNLETIHPHDPTKLVVVTLRLTKKPPEFYVHFYNTLLRRVMQKIKYVNINRNFFDPTKKTVMENYKLEIWPGFATAIDFYEGGLMMCISAETRVLRLETVYDVIMGIKSRETNFERMKSLVQEAVVGKSVITRYNNRHYKIDDINWGLKPTDKFMRKDTEISYVDYYRTQYGLNIKNMDQPMLISRAKARKNDPDSAGYYLSLLPEFCNMTGLSDAMANNMTLRRDLISHARTAPEQRSMSIQSLLDKITNSRESQELMAVWGLCFDNELISLTGRIVGAPTLNFGNRSLAIAQPDFTREATTSRAFLPINLENFIVFCTEQDRQRGEIMITNYKQVVVPLGIRFGPNPSFTIVSNRSGRGMPSAADFVAAIKQHVDPQKIQFVIILMPIARDDIYAGIKKQLLTSMSVPSQCILTKTISQEKKLRSVMQKIALQINCKLGGSLWQLSIPLKDSIMFVGIDSHHDPKRKRKSVLALVSTLDNGCTTYYSRIVAQTPSQESADALRPIFTQALAAYFSANHTYPTRIIIFRDGVSDGEMNLVKEQEVVQLRDVANQVCVKPPKFLFIVVQKRINERIFRVNPGGVDNPVPGSCIDHTITRRTLKDFFLVSQLVRNGTVGPSHFVILEDSNENNPDLAQKFAYATSYMYYNWPGSVRVPAMCQYAHKLAMLVGQHLDGEPLADMERQLYYL